MNNAAINEFAWQLMQSLGNKASAEAARRERTARDAGNAEEADQWVSIRKVVEARKGAHAS